MITTLQSLLSHFPFMYCWDIDLFVTETFILRLVYVGFIPWYSPARWSCQEIDLTVCKINVNPGHFQSQSWLKYFSQ